MSAGVVVVTTRTFARAVRAPQRELEAAGLDVVRADTRHDPAELAEPLADAVAWIAGTSPVTDELLAAAPSLRVLARYGVGFDAVDVEAATRRGVWVTNTPGANSEAVADLALALMLDALRHLAPAFAAVARGDWGPMPGRELGATTVGLVGLGRIGQGVARRVQGFGARVLAHDPALDRSPMDGVDLVALDVLAERCDVVSLHAPGGSVVVDEAWLALLHADAVLVNTARGDLVDEDAVAAALREGRLASYAADALRVEHGGPPSPLQHQDLADRVRITPHIGAQTAEAVARMGTLAVRNVLAVLAGHPPPHAVNHPEETS